MPAFHTILIANRGEIAVRVARTARDLGYRTVAVHSEADGDARHTRYCDRAVCIGPAPAAQSYLDVERLLDAARRTGADAVHPGYGFLSENAAFARACAEAGLVFIGPPPEAIELMGDKRRAKIAMEAAGVPCVPGYQGDDQSPETLAAQADAIGFPLMVKAAAGGGGKGMRIVHQADHLAEQVQLAQDEAHNAFGSRELILERALMGPRHVEVQVFGDRHGHVIHLAERDCSVQRRYQKVVEECPSPAVDDDLRARMGQAAVQAARSCGYVGAGTVEFLLDADGAFYFLEMNTRLQVEHPVTEEVTGLDLVAWQLRVARGEALPLAQEQVVVRGHAIEVRLYAEDPARGFLPQTGTVRRFEVPERAGCRADHSVAEGTAVSAHYDPMLAKLVARGQSRAEALRRLRSLVEDTVLLGVPSNQAFLARVLAHPVFASGEANIRFIDEHMAGDPSLSPAPAPREVLALAAVLRFGFSAGPHAERMRGFHSVAPTRHTFLLHDGERSHAVTVEATGCGWPLKANVEVEDQTLPLVVHQPERTALRFAIDAVSEHAQYVHEGDTLWLHTRLGACCVVDQTHAPSDARGGDGDGRLLAPMDGAVVSVAAAEQAAVKQGQTLVVVEAMKMQHQVVSNVDGSVAAVHVRPGQQVKARQLLVEVEPATQEGEG